MGYPNNCLKKIVLPVGIRRRPMQQTYRSTMTNASQGTAALQLLLSALSNP